MPTYSEKLSDPRWQRKRLQILERDHWKCKLCSASDKTLHVHHGYYESGLDPWDYEDETLHTLCKKCHRNIRDLTVHVHRLVALLGPESVKAILDDLHDQYVLEAIYAVEVS